MSFTAGFYHILVVEEGGVLWACGGNENGQLGDGTHDDKPVPVRVMEDVRAVAAGAHHSLVLKSDNTLWAMGENSEDQLGDGTKEVRNQPVKVCADVIAIAAGDSHSLVVKGDNTLWAMGGNDCGQLGDGTKENRHQPVKVMEGVHCICSTHADMETTSIVQKDCGALFAMGSIYGFNFEVEADVDSPIEVMANIRVASRKRKRDVHQCGKVMLQMWEARQFADAVVRCGASEIPVHRAILSAASEVFAAMFQQGMHEGTACKVVIQNAPAEAVEQMIKWVYTAEPPEMQSAAAVMHLANQYAVHDLTQMCAQMLRDEMDATNALETMRSMWLLREQDGLQEVWSDVRTHFWKLTNGSTQLKGQIESSLMEQLLLQAGAG